MPTVRLYLHPRWTIKNVFTGWGVWPLDYFSLTSNNLWDLTQCGGHYYVQQARLHFWSSIHDDPSYYAEYVDVNPPSLTAVASAFHSKYGYRTPTDGTWNGYAWRPEDGDNEWVVGHGSSIKEYPSHSCNWDSPIGLNSTHNNHSTSGDEDRVSSPFASSQSTTVSWTTNVTSTTTHSGLDIGTYTSSDNNWVASSSTVSLSAPNWHSKMVSAESVIQSVISQNGLYPEYDEAAVAKFGTYDVAANTYTAGSTDRLSATEWYAETLKASNALAIARAEIDRLLGQNLEPVSEDEPPVEETLRPEEFDQSRWVSGGVADDPLIELPEFISPEIVEPQDEEVESPPDDVVAPGLLRRASFAPPTQDVSAFSESTYNDLTFSPRETVSPEFPKEEPDA